MHPQQEAFMQGAVFEEPTCPCVSPIVPCALRRMCSDHLYINYDNLNDFDNDNADDSDANDNDNDGYNDNNGTVPCATAC